MSKPMNKIELTELVTVTLRKLHSLTNGKIKFSLGAVDLILGTIAQESAFGKYREQLGNGPAMGIVQMEGATAIDIFSNYLKYRQAYKTAVLSLARQDVDCNNIKSLNNCLKSDDEFAIAMCRIHYLRAPAKLPNHGDVGGYASYWKRYYNTELGAGTVEEFKYNWSKYLGE